MNTDFKPCPFCGGKPHVFFVDKRIIDQKYANKRFPHNLYRIICPGNCCMQSKLYDSLDEAKEAWNRRAKDGE